MFKKLILGTLWKECVSFVKKYWDKILFYLLPMITAITSMLSDAFYFWGWYFIIFSVLSVFLVLTGCMSFKRDIQCKKTKEQIVKDRAKSIEERKKHNAEMEKSAQEHRQRMVEFEKQAEIKMKENNYNEIIIPYQKRLTEITILLPQIQDKTQAMHEISVISKISPLIAMQGVLAIAQNYGIDNPTQNQKSVIKMILEKYDNYQEEVCKLLDKILNSEEFKNNQISKQTIQFLTAITDDNLGILKKQFGYVFNLTKFGGILNYDTIKNDL